MKSLSEHIADVLTAAPKPLAFSALKSKLKAAGVPTVGKSKVSDASIRTAADAIVDEGKSHHHPDAKPDAPPKYWHSAYVSEEDKAAGKAAAKAQAATEKSDAKLKGKADKAKEKADAKAAEVERIGREKAALVTSTLHSKVAGFRKRLVTEKQLGEPKATASVAEREAFRTTLDALIAEGKLFRHGDKYGTAAPVVTHWYESGPMKKPFGDALKTIRKLLESGKVEFEGLTALLKENLGAKPDEPKRSKGGKTTPETMAEVEEQQPETDLNSELKAAYDHLCMFAEFQHGRVEIRRLYHQVIKTHPHMSVADFHKELLDMSRQRTVELHALNEVKEARERELAIERDGRLLYYVIWN